MDTPAVIGREMAERHRLAGAVEHDPSQLLTNYAESIRAGGWSMRSALVRFAQPEATRAGAVLELVRRVDGALHGNVRALDRHVVEHGDGRRDIRTAELARQVGSDPEAVAAYDEVVPLDDEELESLPVLAVAAQLDRLADVLTVWAAQGHEHPPVEAVDEVAAAAFAELERLGVPRETGPPRRR